MVFLEMYHVCGMESSLSYISFFLKKTKSYSFYLNLKQISMELHNFAKSISDQFSSSPYFFYKNVRITGE